VPEHRKRPTILLVIAPLLALVACFLIVYACAAPLPHAMYAWTGEEDLAEQIKGTAALVWLRVTTAEPDTRPYAPIAHSGVSPYGVNTFLEQEAEKSKVDHTLAMIANAGFHWIRQEFPWEDIEISGKGDFWDHKWDVDAWAKYDYIVDAAQEYGLEIIARLDNPPAWSRAVGDAPGWGKGPPDDLEDFGDFVYTLVSRYRGRIRYYQIWNEPNIYPEWGAQPVDPKAYTELLKVAYRRAKEADPDCIILAAGLAQTLEVGPNNLSDLAFLERMYQAGASDYFDVMGAQAYGLWTGPQDRRVSADRTNFARVELLRQIMVRCGDAEKPIWATEVGWNASPDEMGHFPYGQVTEQKQAEYTVRAYLRAQEEWPWLGVMNYWFFRRPSDLESEQPWYYFRMVEPDFRALPVYVQMTGLAGRPPMVHMGYHQEDHYALAYAGRWEAVDDTGAVLGRYVFGDRGAEMTFDFVGTHLTLVLASPAQIEALTVEIDGQTVRDLHPTDDVIVASDGLAVDVGGRLPYEQHNVRLTVSGEGVGLDGLVVWNRTRPAWPWLVGIGILMALGAAWLMRHHLIRSSDHV